MGREDLIDDPRFLTLAERASRSGEINRIVADWASSAFLSRTVTAAAFEHDVPVGTAYSAEDIFADPHMAAPGHLVAVHDPVPGWSANRHRFPPGQEPGSRAVVAHRAPASTTARCGVTSWASARMSLQTWEVAGVI